MNNTYKIFFKYLLKSYKANSIKIFFLSLLETILEVFSISILIVGITYLLSGNKINNNLFNFFLNPDFIDLKNINLFYVIITVYLLKNISLVLINWLKLDYCGKIFKDISSITYKKLLSREYLSLSSYSSGDMAQNVMGESEYAKETVICFIKLFTEILIIISMFFLIFFQNPFLGIKIIIFIFFCSIVYFYFMKKRNISLGKERQINSIKILNLLFQSISSHKLIILRNKFDYFLNKFIKKIDKIYRISRDQTTIQFSAHIWLETCVLIVLFFLLTPYLNNFENFNTKISEIILIVVISLRFIPSFSSILNSTSAIQYGQQAIFNIMQIVSIENDKRENLIENIKYKSFEINNIEIKNINFKYHSQRDLLIKDLNFTTTSNKLIGIKGKNGTGKSTLCYILAGLIKPNLGDIRINNQSIYDNESLLNAYRNCVGYVDQQFHFINESIKKNIAFGEKDNEIDDTRVKECLTSVGMYDFFKKKDEEFDTLIGENGAKLSGGQLQKINLARALYIKPQVLILDEVTNNLDAQSIEEIIKLIHSLKKNILIFVVSHSNFVIEHCDEIIDL